MANNTWGLVETGVITQAIISESTPILAGTWVELPRGVGVGWNYDGQDFTDDQGNPPPTPPEPVPQYRYLLTGPEWVQTFTDDEWNWIKDQRTQTPATTASKGLDKMMDAIRWTNSVDVSHPNMDQFYTWLLNNGIPGGQTRIDELREGILE